MYTLVEWNRLDILRLRFSVAHTKKNQHLRYKHRAIRVDKRQAVFSRRAQILYRNIFIYYAAKVYHQIFLSEILSTFQRIKRSPKKKMKYDFCSSNWYVRSLISAQQRRRRRRERLIQINLFVANHRAKRHCINSNFSSISYHKINYTKSQ